MESKRVAYLVFLTLFTLIILSSILNIFFNYEETLRQFTSLGYPDHLVLPLAVAQSIGLLIILSNKGGWLINWAYSGFFINLALAVTAHFFASHGNGALAVLGLVFLWSTYVLNKQLKHLKDKKLKSDLQMA